MKNRIIIKTKELTLKQLSEKDKDFFTGLYRNKEVMQFVSTHLNEQKTEKLFKEVLNNNKYLLFVIELSNGEKAGFTGLQWNQDCVNDVEIGTVLNLSYHGKNIAYLAKKYLIQYAIDILKVGDIFAFCESQNESANKVAVRVGLQLFGNFKNNKNVEMNKYVIRTS